MSAPRAPQRPWVVVFALLVFVLMFAGCDREPTRSAPSVAASKPEIAPARPVEPSAQAPRFKVIVDGNMQLVEQIDSRCPWLEYSVEWKSLRLRRDRVGCEPAPLEPDLPIARDMIAFLRARLGELFAPTSFGLTDYPQLYQRVAQRALASPAWDAARGRPRKRAIGAYVVETAKAPEFYPEVRSLFEGSGVRAELSGVEKVFVGPVTATPFAAALLREGATPGARVPYGSQVWFHLEAVPTQE